MVVVVIQLEAAVTVAVLVAAAVVASWLLVEGKMYLLPASAVRTSVDRNRMFMLQERRDAMRGAGGENIINTYNPFTLKSDYRFYCPTPNDFTRQRETP